jgi:branched-chain amino acid transport system substrate-binding protein
MPRSAFAPLPLLPTLAALTAVTAVGTACARNPDAASVPTADAPVAIGVGVLPSHPLYQDIAAGVQLAVDRLNESRGSRFVVQLPAPGTTANVRLAQQLVDNPAVRGVVGGADNEAVHEALPILADTDGGGARALPLVSPSAAASRLSGVNAWFFRVTPNDKDVARFAARWIRDSLPAGRAVVVYHNAPVGRDWSATFTEAFTRNGGSVLIRRPYLAGITEWEAYARLMAKLAPDVILFAGTGDDLLAFREALSALALAIPMVASPEAALLEGHPRAGGIRYLAVREGGTPEGRTFAQRYRQRHGRTPTLNAALAYDAALVIGRGVQRGGTSRALLRDALEGTGNGAPSVQGALGLIAFRYNHDIRGRTVAVAMARGAAGAP